MLDKAVG